jgi:hypothetical protein
MNQRNLLGGLAILLAVMAAPVLGGCAATVSDIEDDADLDSDAEADVASAEEALGGLGCGYGGYGLGPIGNYGISPGGYGCGISPPACGFGAPVGYGYGAGLGGVGCGAAPWGYGRGCGTGLGLGLGGYGGCGRY